MSHRSNVVSVLILRRFPLKENTQTKMILPSQMTEMPETETMMNENQNADRNYQRDYDYDDDEHRCGVGGYGGSSWFEW